MLERLQIGRVPPKHHIVFPRDAAEGAAPGAIHHEECLTRDGFDGPYTILYHRERPHAQHPAEVAHGWELPLAVAPERLAKRHYLSSDVATRGGAPVDARVPLLFSRDVVTSVAFPDASDPVYFSDGDSDTLVYVFAGGGTLRTLLGDVAFEKDDYVFVPRGLLHRFLLDPAAGPQHWLVLELRGGLHIPRQFLNGVGQLKMDAPFTHRDFRRPVEVTPRDEGIRELLVKRNDAFHGFRYDHAPLDVVGWDGTVYPWVFPILNFQPRAGQTHLPPTLHGTFAARGALICSFVPRVVDFHPQAIPCPYPHSSVDVDEIIFYCRGNFTSRRGVGPGSISYHPAGIPHGPHPGAYEGSIGHARTDELAVMLDCFEPLRPTAAALGVEDPHYMESFLR
jgi:homogentisate 1,2-dioxygenase